MKGNGRMKTKSVVVSDPVDVDRRLHQIGAGLTQTVLWDTADAGEGAAAGCTAHHPPSFAGTARWAEMVRYIRDTLVPLGWTRSDYKNFSTLVSPDGTHAIAIARGDEGTGEEALFPSTLYPKGSATQEAIDGNLLLPFDDVRAAENRRELRPLVSTWLFLHSRAADEIRCELSRPTKIDASGFVDAWSERILLTPIQLNRTKVPVPQEPVNPVVTVRRRNG
jgi:hypothetical protein